MRILKVIAVVGIVALGAKYFKSCEFDLPFVTREALESSQAETREARAALESVQENYARQNRELNSILAELTEISGQTISLQVSQGDGYQKLTQAERIDNNLTALKSRINDLERVAEDARKKDKNMAISAKTIKTLRATIAAQEREIETLRKTVSDRDETIRAQGNVIAVQKDTISRQYQTILVQQEKLRQTVASQTEMLYQAGRSFEQLADDGETALNVSGRRDKEMVREYKRAIYTKAEQFYEQASSEHHAEAAGRCEVVKYKLASL